MRARILAVLDEESFRSDFKKYLEPDHTVTVCDNISGGKQQISDITVNGSQKPFDLIVCAINVGDEDNGNAMDFLKWTRTNTRLQEIPFVLLCTRKGLIMNEFMSSLRSASKALGAVGLLVANNIASENFRNAIEEYLPFQTQYSLSEI